uniref:Uncharacterized protein n=1 Tax=Micrurus corallinus TaxID=54390 RepID=A0A2D4EYD0_MICCO
MMFCSGTIPINSSMSFCTAAASCFHSKLTNASNFQITVARLLASPLMVSFRALHISFSRVILLLCHLSNLAHLNIFNSLAHTTQQKKNFPFFIQIIFTSPEYIISPHSVPP